MTTTIDICPGCRQPAHASETNDEGYHLACLPRFEVKKTIRRSPWNRIRNRRGGKQVLWLVVDNHECRIVSELYTRRAANARALELTREALGEAGSP